MGISIWQLLIILAIVLVIFGTKKLRDFGGDLGGAIKNFKTSMKDEDLAAFKQMHAELNETRNLLQKSASDTFNDFSGAMHDVTQLAETTGDVDESVSVTAKLPAAPASKPLPKKSSRAPRKTSAKSVSKKIVTKKVVAKKTATKTNRTPHGRVKKT